MGMEQQWYDGWEKEFPKDYVETLHKPAITEIMDYFQKFLEKQNLNSCFEVLNAFPGHGKTTALKLLVKKLIENKFPKGGLIVCREREQMGEIEGFAAAGSKLGVLYVDSENFREVRQFIHKYQFVVISHERLKNIALSPNPSENESLYWNNQKRFIIIDEAPTFVDSVEFDIGNGLGWLDDCFHAVNTNKGFVSEEIIILRSVIQMIMAKELLRNTGYLTNPLKVHLDSPNLSKTVNDFFEIMDLHISKITNKDSLSLYKWFKRLYTEDDVGYIDNGFYANQYSDHKKIICSQRIDYRSLGCSILILDGTAIHTPLLYNGEYGNIVELSNYTKYNRLTIHQRIINTSARRRKRKQGVTVQHLIASDIKSIKEDKGIRVSRLFPLMNKYEIYDYVKLDVISNQDYKSYFQVNNESGSSPINILNTIGKNHLANIHGLYLTSLPNRPASYYKAIAVSLYKESENPLNMSMERKDKVDQETWFADSRIEAIYRECLISELIQIIHRSNIRHLLVSSSDKVHVFIATKFNRLIGQLVSSIGSDKVSIKRYEVENHSRLEQKWDLKVKSLVNIIKRKNLMLPQPVGKIEEGTSMKNIFRNYWSDEEKRTLLIQIFHNNGLTVIEEPTQTGKLNKKIDYLR